MQMIRNLIDLQFPRFDLSGVFSADSLPDDVLPEEVTVVICFKTSLWLNRLLGGAPDMTFSARSHMRANAAHPTRYFWWPVVAMIDIACAMLRGEDSHCEAAWLNHCARKSRLP